MGRRRTITLPIDKGQWSGGDPALLPDGYLRKARNMLRNSGVWSLRPQFTYDNLTGIRFLALWRDESNKAERLVAANATAQIYVKDATGETWSSVAVTDSRGGWVNALDSTNFKGQLFLSTSDASRNPFGIVSYNGTSISADPFKIRDDVTQATNGYMVRCKTLCTFNERIFLGGVSFYPYDRLGSSLRYDPTNAFWTKNACTAANVSDGTSTVGRLTPTSTTGAYFRLALAVAYDQSKTRGATWLCYLRGVHPSYDVPVTLKFYLRKSWTTATAVTVGALYTPTTANLNGFRYRCTDAGTTDAATEPTWPTTIGTTVADNDVTWVCEATDVLASLETEVPNITDVPDFTPYVLSAALPPFSSDQTSVNVLPSLEFGNTANPTITLAAIDVSFKDGLDDEDARKRCFGQQLTDSILEMPFVNIEDATDAEIDVSDRFYWSDVADARLRANAFYRVTEVPGPITAIRSVGGKLVVFKRNARWVFAAVDNPDIVVLPEGNAKRGAGCLNAQAIDIADDGTLYYIGENEVYRWSVDGEPEPLCGEGMRDEIMSKSSSTWVESASYPANIPWLHIDKANGYVYVYTQKGLIYVYDIEDEAWSFFETGGGDDRTPEGYETCAAYYNPNTGHMYYAFTEAAAGTAGLARLDATQAVAKDSISTSGTNTVYGELWLRPIELSGPRFDITLENGRAHHKVTASQTDQTLTAYVSFDQGTTFTKYNEVTIAPVSAGEYHPIDLPLYQTGGTLMLALVHEGQGGATNFTISQIEADIQVMRGEYRQDHPTAVGSSL